ncbi:MAG TPA: type IV toxin-antitoxin system AbiEi family antitoxin [Bacteroidales bacterium]|nr:type IV toxin-antitoxin system AbiEi family antitoxin [Bacteroidales bacterium]
MKQQEQSISDWINEKLLRGYYTFTIEDIQNNFPQFSKAYISTSLYRLTVKKKIISPWRGFYVIMPIEFALKGIIPPIFYIDALMAFLNKKYYVCLLNAASFYGASHQRVQRFSVMTEAPKLRNTAKTGTPILFFSKKDIPEKFIRHHKTQLGYVNVSSPELTAIDLVANEKYVGGLNRVCTVLNELVESFDFDKLEDDFFDLAPTPIYQRFGYILDSVLEREDLAEIFKTKISLNLTPIRNVPFKVGKSTEGCIIDKKWKVIINQEIDIDE